MYCRIVFKRVQWVGSKKKKEKENTDCSNKMKTERDYHNRKEQQLRLTFTVIITLYNKFDELWSMKPLE